LKMAKFSGTTDSRPSSDVIARSSFESSCLFEFCAVRAAGDLGALVRT
jgi:hypothetical protein